MSRREELQALLERVREAKADCRLVDGAIKAALEPPRTGWDDEVAGLFINYSGDGLGRFKSHHATPAAEEEVVPRYTASIDAALALVERVLPLSGLNYRPGDFTWDMIRRHGGSCKFVLMRSGGWAPPFAAQGATATLAILSALLVALIAKEGPADVQ